MRFFTTQNKKVLASTAFAITGWYAITAGANPIGLPALPSGFTNPVLAGFSLVITAGIIAVIAAIQVWTEY